MSRKAFNRQHSHWFKRLKPGFFRTPAFGHAIAYRLGRAFKRLRALVRLPSFLIPDKPAAVKPAAQKRLPVHRGQRHAYLPSFLVGGGPIEKPSPPARRKASFGVRLPISFPAALTLAVGLVVLLGYGLLFIVVNAGPSATVFAYQGRLVDQSESVEGTCDFRFNLYDAKFGGAQLGKTVAKRLALSRGTFNTELDFGRAAFDYKRPYLEVSVRCPEGAGRYTRLLRQLLTSRTPFDLAGYSALVERTSKAEDPPLASEQRPPPRTGPNPPPWVTGYGISDRSSGGDVISDLGPDLRGGANKRSPGTRATDAVQGHDGVKRSKAVEATTRASEFPGDKRNNGGKGAQNSLSAKEYRNPRDSTKSLDAPAPQGRGEKRGGTSTGNAKSSGKAQEPS